MIQIFLIKVWILHLIQVYIADIEDVDGIGLETILQEGVDGTSSEVALQELSSEVKQTTDNDMMDAMND